MTAAVIAILGATSHISKCLISSFAQSGATEVHLFTRSPAMLTQFLAHECREPRACLVVHDGYAEFSDHRYHVIINCVGVGTYTKLNGDFSLYFTVAEKYDNLVLGYLNSINNNALYIAFSSGAVYGRGHDEPFDEDTVNYISVNHLPKNDYYAITRLYSEAKHRSYERLNIVDIRIFSFFSRYIDLNDGYFITELLDCIMNGRLLTTDADNMMRDYLHPDDLHDLIMACMAAGRINTAFDAMSRQPVDKQTVLDYFVSENGLHYRVQN